MAAMGTFALPRLAGILALGLGLGLLIEPVWVWILAASCLYLGWQLLTLYRLDRWLRLRSQIDPPNLGGSLGAFVGLRLRQPRRKQGPKQRLILLFRALRLSNAGFPNVLSSLIRQRASA